jgi:hypothetical protein
MRQNDMADDFTPDEKLSVVENQIENLRRAMTWSSNKNIIRDLEVFKQIAKDIAGQKPYAPNRAKDRLERAMNLHTDQQRLAKIAEVVQSEWATIRQALEQFKGET